MDGNLSKALWLGVSILLFIAVVTIGLSIFGSMKDVSAQANDRIGSISQSMAEEEFRIFDGKEVSGSEVVSALSNFSARSGEVLILIATLGKNGGNSVNLNPSSNASIDIGAYTKYVSDTSGSLSIDKKCVILSGGSDSLLTSVSKTVQDAARRDAENPNLTSLYINPTGKFISHLIYDANLKIRGVVFAQMK